MVKGPDEIPSSWDLLFHTLVAHTNGEVFIVLDAAGLHAKVAPQIESS
jgi:hypothetical protein